MYKHFRFQSLFIITTELSNHPNYQQQLQIHMYIDADKISFSLSLELTEPNQAVSPFHSPARWQSFKVQSIQKMKKKEEKNLICKII